MGEFISLSMGTPIWIVNISRPRRHALPDKCYIEAMKRFCTKCGQAGIKQSDSLYICTSGHENWINPAAGSSVFVVHDGRVLYGVRSIEPGRGKLCPPGGFIEIGETAEQAAIRETKEEVGLDVTLEACLGTYGSMYEERHILNIVFVATCTDLAVNPGDDMSGGDPQWRSLGELPELHELSDDWYAPAHADLIAWYRRTRTS